MSSEFEILLLACIVAVACALPGVFLILRKVSLMSDAISHSILLGIVIAFFLTHSLHSPLLIVGAALVGILTVLLTEALIKTRKVKEDASIAFVFPLLFSIAVILITKFAGNVHLDQDAVLVGEIAYAPIDRFIANGIDYGPKAIYTMGAILLVNALFVLILYKELKLSTFDKQLAVSLGFLPVLLHYALMVLVSITAVGAFNAVGSILVVALMITPAATAYFLSKNLKTMIWLSVGIGMLSAILGYGMSYAFNLSIAGSMATMTGILFLAALLIAPQKGIIAKLILQKQQLLVNKAHLLLVHLLDHENTDREKVENTLHNAVNHMGWDEQLSSRIVSVARSKKWITSTADQLFLTKKGRELAQELMVKI